jgi:glucosylceramidase
MYLDAGQSVRLGKQVKLQLDDAGLPPLKILAYDHNWDEVSYPLESLRAANTPFVGTAWHCYAGDMKTAQSAHLEAFPEAEQHFTECTGSYPGNRCDISKGKAGFGFHHNWDMANVYLGSVSYGAQSGIKWIMVLDEECGPYLPGVHFQWGRPLVSVPKTASSMADIEFNQDFWTTGIMARFIRPGAYRVNSELTSASTPNAIIEAFRDDARGTLTVIAVNLDRDRALPLTIGVGRDQLQYTMPRWSTVNIVMANPEAPLGPSEGGGGTIAWVLVFCLVGLTLVSGLMANKGVPTQAGLLPKVKSRDVAIDLSTNMSGAPQLLT